MKRRTIALVVSMVLALAVGLGGTLAYLTDRDSDVNVFTIGNVDIELTEDFRQGAELIPGKKIEKEVSVVNTGNNDAWVWTTIAIPTALDDDDASKNVLHFNFTADSIADGLWNWKDENGDYNMKQVTIDNVEYNLYTVMYETKLQPGETTAHPVMTQVYLDYHVDVDPNGDMFHVEGGVVDPLDWNLNDDGAPKMYVAAYAIQTEGFDTVQEGYAAYGEQWGEIGGAKYSEPVIVYTADELTAALADPDVSEVVLGNDITANVNVPADAKVELNLNDNSLNGSVGNAGELDVADGKIENNGVGIENTGVMNVNNVELKAGSAGDYCVISGTDSETTLDNVDINSAGGGVGAVGGAELVFNSGKVYVDTSSTSGRYVFYAAGEGTKITINGGTFGWDPKDNQKRAYIYAGAGTTVIVNGGTFGKASIRADYSAGIMGEGTVIITGGTFGFDPTKWVDDGYEAVKTDGTWTVSAK